MKIKNFADIIVDDYPFFSKLKEEIVSILENYSDCQNRKSNVKATMTEWNILSPQIDKFKRYILNEIEHEFGHRMVNSKGNLTPIFGDLWGNIYHKGDYTMVHNHSPAMFSLVLFLKTKWYHSSLLFTDSGERIRPKEGRFIIFPAYLWHEVAKHRYNESRITLSGNIYWEELCDKSWFNDTDPWVKIA